MILPPLEEARAAVRPERVKWEAQPRRMIAVGGMEAAKIYSDKAVPLRHTRGSGASDRKGKEAPQVDPQLAEKIAALLKESIREVMEAKLPGQARQVCEKAVGRLGKTLSRLDPPMQLTREAVERYMPVPHANGLDPMYVPEKTAKAACYKPKGEESAAH